MMAALAGDGAPTLRNLHKWSLKLGASPFQAYTQGTGAAGRRLLGSHLILRVSKPTLHPVQKVLEVFKNSIKIPVD